MQIEILAKTEDYIVVNKPSGVLAHRANDTTEETLVDWFLHEAPESRNVGDDPAVRPGIVHRLDREASGVIVLARTQKMFECLKRQFQNHEVEKQYFALVHGRTKSDYGVIELPIRRKKGEGRMAASSMGDDDARPARTEFTVLERFGNATLLSVRILSGRTHQIRVHLFSRGTAVVGDTLYRPRRISKSFPKPPRLFLHSAQLAFLDLAGNRASFPSPLPHDLLDYLLQFKSIVKK